MRKNKRPGIVYENHGNIENILGKMEIKYTECQLWNNGRENTTQSFLNELPLLLFDDFPHPA
jgi:hypothetical protein